jgi:hypothetical protein
MLLAIDMSTIIVMQKCLHNIPLQGIVTYHLDKLLIEPSPCNLRPLMTHLAILEMFKAISSGPLSTNNYGMVYSSNDVLANYY